jgi:tripartite-type tricarboxylate transporter receptor subunit TctC
MKTRAAVLICIATLAVPSAEAVLAQVYPTKPVRIIVAQAPGAQSDIFARLLGQKLSESLGQSVISDPRPGAGGAIGAELAARAAPDGHTLLMGTNSTHGSNPALYAKLPYDPIKDFAPIAMMAHVPGILVAHPSFPAKTVAELIKLAKAKPGALTHGSSSIGSSSHLNMELFKQMAGIDMLLVSYPGDAPALVALLGGHVQFAFNNAVVALPHIQSGKLRAIAVATAQRLTNLPEVPTIAESGLPGYEGLLFYGLFAPAKTPAAIIDKLNEAMKRIKQTPAVRQQLSALGAVSVDMTPDELGGLIKRELDKWTQVVRAGGIQAE